MLQNPCKTLGFKKNMVYKIPLGGEVNHIQPVAYYVITIVGTLVRFEGGPTNEHQRMRNECHRTLNMLCGLANI